MSLVAMARLAVALQLEDEGNDQQMQLQARLQKRSPSEHGIGNNPFDDISELQMLRMAFALQLGENARERTKQAMLTEGMGLRVEIQTETASDELLDRMGAKGLAFAQVLREPSTENKEGDHRGDKASAETGDVAGALTRGAAALQSSAHRPQPR